MLGPLLLLATLALGASVSPDTHTKNDKTVLILGGGVAGVIAARTLASKNIKDFLIIEGRDELGGRMRSMEFGVQGKTSVVELGANWIQGTQEGNGPANPIYALAKKHGLKTAETDFYGSIVTYDETGPVDYLDALNTAVDAYTNLTVVGGGRVPTKQVDTTCRTGYSLIGAKPKTPADMVVEYYVDWEYAQTPEQTSWIASSWANNFTFDVDQGGFSDDNLLSVDQRGFKHLIQAEAAEFLHPSQVLLNATVRTIAHSADGVVVTLANGTRISGDYAITTFSLGVLQHDDVVFEPALPLWKQEAIQSMTMATYTKLFLQFEEKFWFDTDFALYADKVRGRYPVWQGLDLDHFFPGSGIIFATVTGDYSEAIEALPDAEIQSQLLEVLGAMFPNITIPTPTAFFFPRWFSDPLYRGSYSNWPASFVSPHHTNLRANVGHRLWFSGEAMSQKYFGFLHGAYFEGMDAAEHVVSCVSAGGKCQSLPFVESIPNSSPYVI
ncbi:amine oxidase [Roridomyces roridus]|uniref:Amine oxidase n=1 Tax=Roridomyces roridus TaxID=1738132 RepID=A0AAD7F9H5_9AGAR|nr:amine oxidase [Roridomyces roridus]